MDSATCANCSAPLAGPYCSQCGQHAHESSRSIGALFHDAWHVVTHVDGRFWRTMRALAFKPGRLTREYFAERRARYLPPVRLYLVLSLLFFALASTGQHTRGLGFDLDASTGEGGATTAAQAEQIKRDVRAAVKEAKASGVPISDSNDGLGFRMDTTKCDWVSVPWKWLEKPLRDSCERNVADGGRAMLSAFVASIPKMMFVFLPLMALLLMLIYWWPRHYYVEHLVFFLHTHAAIFLVLLLELVLSRLSQVLPLLASVDGYLKFAGFLYVIWYIYRAMRVYYGQGRWLTLTKIAVVGCAYLLFLSVTLGATVLVVALLA